MNLSFTKMEGLGNDFVVLDGPWRIDPTLVASLCDRRRGIGADGVLVVTRREGSVEMGYWNADGSASEMCGNGLRCVARYAADRGFAPGPDFSVDTAIGPRRVQVHDDLTVTAELGPVSWGGAPTSIEGREWWTAEVGNPHAITLGDDFATAVVNGLGPVVEHSFPNGANVEFAVVRDRRHIDLRVWERGVGETLACGTGAAATAAVASYLGKVDLPVTVRLPGGDLRVDVDGEAAWITGPATYVFEGEWRR